MIKKPPFKTNINQSYALYKTNPNKRAHDLNEEIKKILKQQKQDFFLLALTSIFQLFFNDSIFIFMPEEETAKQKLSGDIQL